MNKHTIDVKWYDLRNWIKTGEQPRGYKFSVWIDYFFDTPDKFPDKIKEYDWSKTFNEPTVIYYDERITVNTLELLHAFLRSQCGNIENITLISLNGVGVKDWWLQRNRLYQEKSFAIVEWLFMRSIYWDNRSRYFKDLEIPSDDFIKNKKKDIRYAFSLYGGTNPRIDRLYITLKLRDLDDLGLIDIMTEYETEKTDMINHAMYLGYFQNIHEQNEISRLYDTWISDKKLKISEYINTLSTKKIKDQPFSYNNIQFDIDSKCLACVCNETSNTQPFTMVSEKTLRPFWNFTAAIPLGYKSVEGLEKFGFWFPHDLIDYSYQYEPDWLTRLNLIIASLKNISNINYNEYFLKNFENFKHNAILIKKYYTENI